MSTFGARDTARGRIKLFGGARRSRLAHTTAGDMVAVPPEYVRGLDPELEGRLAEAGALYLHVRPRDYHGDATPHLAIHSAAWRRDLVLEEIAEWHRGW